MKTYTTTKVEFEVLTKKINRLAKKIKAVGGNIEFTTVREFVKNVPVYEHDEFTQTKVDEVNVDCVEYTLNFDPYKVGNYRFGAVIEKSDDPNNNLIYVTDDTVDFTQYRCAKLRCEHCKTNHNRVKCVVLIDNNTGAHKMVGTSCLKDFIGYNVEMFAKYFREIQEILLDDEEPKIYAENLGQYKTYIDTREYLAYCIDIVKTYGYNKECKTTAYKNMRANVQIDKSSYKTADEVIEFFNNYDTDDYFESDVKVYVTGKKPVSYENGFIAYAYTLYGKILDRIEKERVDADRKAKTDYIGNIGDKITAMATFARAGSYEVQFGYYPTLMMIYKFTTDDGNVLIWKTSKGLAIENGTRVEITGTIKDHNEYNDEKQTVLTRCKIKECVTA
jgi:hypothetical protein